jgi:type I restriction enzyme S subunit
MKSGWVTKKLDEVCEIIYGYPFDSKLFNNNQKGKPVIRIRDVVRGFSETFTTEPCDSKYWISKDDVLIGMDGDFNISTWKSSRALLNQRVCKLESGEKITNLYLRYILPTKLQGIWDKKLFTTVKHLSAKDLNSISISIPPLAEQKRIVAKIDAAFEKIDKLKANAEKNLANAKELFQSALDEAMRPKDGWVEKRLGEVGATLTGMTPSTRDKSNFGNFMPFVKPADIMPFNPINYREEGLSQKGVSCSRLIKSDSVLMVCIGASIGKTGYADRDCTCNQQINALIPNGFDGRYLYYMLSSDKFKKKLMEDAGQATLPIINKSKWENLSICVSLSLSEQREIVNRLDLLAEKIKMLEQNYTQQIADCVEMRQAVLREAFEGRL